MVSIDIKFKTKDILMELKKDKTYNDIILELINKESETKKKIKEIVKYNNNLLKQFEDKFYELGTTTIMCQENLFYEKYGEIVMKNNKLIEEKFPKYFKE